jgi:transcriptional regulator with XRE-family HTH domain
MNTVDIEQLQTLVFAPQKLRDARLRRFPAPEWSLRRVAKELLNIAPQTLSEYELGKCSPGPSLLARMCVLYEVELQELTELNLAA